MFSIAARLQPVLLLLSAPFAWADPSGPAPPITGSAIYEDFESYSGLLPYTPWPVFGGFMRGPYGFWPETGLDRIVKGSGDYSLRITYRTGPMDQITLSRLYQPDLDWTGYDAVRFWLKPDGSGRRVTFFVLEKIREDRKKWFWEAGYDMTGTEPVIVTMPFSAFYQTAEKPDHGKRFDPSFIYETAFWVRAAHGNAPTVFARAAWPVKSPAYDTPAANPRARPLGAGLHNPQVPSTIWLDDFTVVKLRDKLDHVSAAPAPQGLAPAPNADGILRVDFGSEADWTDARGRHWRADAPASQGVLFNAPDVMVVGTDVPHLHRHQRHGAQRFRFHLPDGAYVVRLHFCELDPRVTGPRQRVFAISLSGGWQQELDVWKAAGGAGIAHVITVPVTATREELVLEFAPIGQRALLPSIISAIEIAPAGAPSYEDVLAATPPSLSSAGETFESYPDNVSLRRAWASPAPGSPPALFVERSVRGGGHQGLRLDYVLGNAGRTGVTFTVPASARRLRFWYKPDGSGHQLELATTGGRRVFRVPLAEGPGRFVEAPLPFVADAGPRTLILRIVAAKKARGGVRAGAVFVDELSFL
jgi:hypothetical protein